MSSGHSEVRAKLTLDDAASDVLHKVSHGFHEVRHNFDHVQHGLKHFALNAFGTAVGFQLHDMVGSFKHFGHEIYDAALGAKQQQKEIAGILTMTDRAGQSFGQLTDEAEHVHHEIQKIAVATGQTTSAVVDSFNTMSARSNKSAEEMVVFTKQMAMASKAAPGGLEEVSSGFAMLEAGMIRARNPVVMMIASTGLLGGNAKEVAKQLQKMKPEEAMAMGEKAIEKMAGKMKNMPASVAGSIKTFKEIREQFFEAAGMPMVEALAKPLGQLKKYFVEHREEVVHWAHAVGEHVGEWVKEAAEKIREGFKYIQTHADQIEHALKTGWGYAKTVAQFIIDHRKLIAAAFILNMGGGMGGGGGMLGAAAKGGGSLLSLGNFISKTTSARTATPTDALFQAGGLFSAGTTANVGKFNIAMSGLKGQISAVWASTSPAIKGLGALGLAIGAWTVAIGQWNSLMGEMDKQHEDRMKLMNELNDMAKSGNRDAVENEVAYLNSIGAINDGMVDHVNTIIKSADTYKKLNDGLQMSLNNAQLMGNMGLADMQAEQIAQSYAMAGQTQATGMQHMAATALLNSGYTAAGLKMAGVEIAGGLDAFAGMFAGASEEVKKKLAIFLGQGGDGVKVEPPKVNFNGGQTFNIKQDFRDQDPDRIALVFQNDILRAATARRAARLGTAFGL